MTHPDQPLLPLIPHDYAGQLIAQRSRDGYVNATAMCRAAGKLFGHYNGNQAAKDFVAELSSAIGIPITKLVQSVNGGNPALQGTWVHPQVAIHLAQWLSPAFAVSVTQWVYDWMSGLSPSNDAWQIFQERISLVYDNVPAGYFCIFKESADIYATMINGGAPMGAKMVLDISIGHHWGNHWKNSGFNERFGDRHFYPHEYPIRYPQSASNPQRVACYPDSALAEFRRWMREEYNARHLPPYLKTLVRDGRLAPVAANQTLQAIEQRERGRTRVR